MFSNLQGNADIPSQKQHMKQSIGQHKSNYNICLINVEPDGLPVGMNQCIFG